MCNGNCNRLCPNLIISTGVSIVAIDGTDTLVIDIPAGTYGNSCKYCLVIAQAIPTGATITTPVAISIGGDTTTVYPLVCYKTCLQALACQVRTRTKICTYIQTDTVSGVFKAVYGLGAYCPDVLASLPVGAVAPAVASGDVAVASFSAEPMVLNENGKLTKTTTTTTKEVLARE